MQKPISVWLVLIITIISMGTNSFAQTDSEYLQTEEQKNGNVESIEQVDTTLEDQVSIQIDEESIQVLEESIQNSTSIFPYLAIILAGIIGGIIVIKKRNKGKDGKDYEDYEEDDDYEYYENEEKGLTSGSKPMAPNFQEMQKDSRSDNIDEIYPEQIIESKIRIISKLQEYKIGDDHKLEEIKQLLIADGSFTQDANDYLEAKYKEYKKMAETNSEE